ncbi:MAG: MarR family transcriptional regulator [Clostridia bacterium]|nr:MarR family transcriptional regulator [Clostridia bacterium]
MPDEVFFAEAADRLLGLVHQSRHRALQQNMHRMRVGEQGMLIYLANQPGAVTAGQIARDMQIGSGGVANMLNILEKKGYVSRSMSLHDRRSVVVAISEEGREVVAEKRREVRNTTAAILSELGEADTRELVRIMGRLIEITDRRICAQESTDEKECT